MKRCAVFAIFFVVLLASFVAAAEVSFIGVSNETYNLGDAIAPLLNVSSEIETDALFGLSIVCGDYELQYFITPIELSAKGTEISSPALKVSNNMIGDCSLIASVAAIDKSFSELKQSNFFQVSDELAMDVGLSKTEALPSDKIAVSVKVSPSYGSFLGTVSIFFDGELASSTEKAEFSYLLELAEDIKSGNHIIFVESNDSFGNRGREEIVLLVVPKASVLILSTNKKNFGPDETLKYYARLIDQASDDMPNEITAELISPTGNIVFTEHIFSDVITEFAIDQFFAPGTYVLRVSAEGLEAEEEVIVDRVDKVDVGLVNETLIITNLGNVPYEKTVEIVLSKDNKDTIVKKKISLAPADSESIDLSKEVKSSGKYDVTVNQEGEKPIVYNDVDIKDTRSIFEKMGSGLESITSSMFGIGDKDAILTKKPVLIAIGVIVVIIILRMFSKRGAGRNIQQMRSKEASLEAERMRSKVFEKRKMEEVKKSKYHLDRSLREREDIKKFLKMQQQRMKNK